MALTIGISIVLILVCARLTSAVRPIGQQKLRIQSYKISSKL